MVVAPPPCSSSGPGQFCCVVLPPQGSKSPSMDGMACRNTRRSAPQLLPVLETSQKRGGSSPSPSLLYHPQSKRSPSTRTCQDTRYHMNPMQRHHHQTFNVNRSRPRSGMPNWRDEADLGLASMLLPSTGAWRSLHLWGVLGFICWPQSLYKYLLRGKDVKSSVQ